MLRRLLPIAALALLASGCGGSSRSLPPELLFVSTRDADYAVFGASVEGEDAFRLTKEKGDPSTPAGLFFQVAPAWAPDGRRIAFVSGRDGVGHIFVMGVDGTGTTRLTNSDSDDQHPSWSPSGTAIVFAREGALFRVPATGGTARRVGRGPGSAADPAYSPDGMLIAYDYRQPGIPAREVYVMKADGTGIRQLTRLGRTSGIPAWSPDGARIAFQSDARLGHNEIYTIGVGGGGLRRMTTSTTDAIQPAWSPDGSRLAFSRDGAIWVVESGRERQLTSGEDNDSDPVFRPAPVERAGS